MFGITKLVKLLAWLVTDLQNKFRQPTKSEVCYVLPRYHHRLIGQFSFKYLAGK